MLLFAIHVFVDLPQCVLTHILSSQIRAVPKNNLLGISVTAFNYNFVKAANTSGIG